MAESTTSGPAVTTTSTAAVASTPDNRSSKRRRAFDRFGFFAPLLRLLVPIYKDWDAQGRVVLMYTSFPRYFFSWIFWLPGLILVALNSMGLIEESLQFWLMLLAGTLWYFTVAEDLTAKGAVVVASSVAGFLALFFTGFLDWTGFPWLVDKLKNMVVTSDASFWLMLCTFMGIIWIITYMVSVIWRRRELGSNRRSKIRPPFGRKPLPIAGMIVDNPINDVLEWFFGFFCYDIEITYRDGRKVEEGIDRNVVGLGFYLGIFNKVISHIDTSTTNAAELDDNQGGDGFGNH